MDRQEAVRTLAEASRALRVDLQRRLAERVDGVIDYVEGGHHEEVAAESEGNAANKDNAAERGERN